MGSWDGMANEVVLLTNGDARGESIVASFAQQTGLTIEPMEDGARFALHGSDHDIKVVETLTRIDPDWSGYLTLGQPEAQER